MKTGNFNKTHPELKKGEVFLTNASDERMPAGGRCRKWESDWESIGWRTKRRGVTAYDIYGKAFKYAFPVFVQRSELVRAGVNPAKL